MVFLDHKARRSRQIISGTTLEHAETLTRQRIAVKDYFPKLCDRFEQTDTQSISLFRGWNRFRKMTFTFHHPNES
jgi:hypothetical protein